MTNRINITASALGDYFGVGFNSPMERLSIDLGQITQEFDEESEKRMRLGIDLEDAVLNHFEYLLGISITNRNTKVLEDFDGMLRLKVDGETIFEGVPTVVECKVSNSTMGPFTTNRGYLLQCQAYMRKFGYEQCLLLGLYQGKPIYKLIKRDEETIKDIEEMVTTIFGILGGVVDVDEFPWDLVNKYSGTEKQTLDEFDVTDKDIALQYVELKEQEREIKKQLDFIADAFKEKYEVALYEDEDVRVNISQSTYRGGLDETALQMALLDEDLNKFRKPSTVRQRLTITKKKR